MSGATSRGGFRFQDLVLAERVLAHILARRASSISGAAAPHLRFGVEAALPNNEGPEWDSLQGDGTTWTLEEAKSGAVQAEDRWTLWRRVRRTVEGLVRDGDGSDLRVSLTVNAAALPANPEYWRALAAQSQIALGAWTTPAKKEDGRDERRRAVQGSRDLADEALHVLTSADADADAGSQPMSLECARHVLARVSFNELHNADSVETQVLAHLGALSRDVGVKDLLAALRGQISQHAELSDPSRRFFSADDLLRSFAVLERLAAVDPRALRSWQTLRASALANEVDDTPAGGLAYQDWKSIQPAAAVELQSPAPRAVALLGRGGIGKSVALHRWLSERRAAGDESLLLLATDLAAFEPEQIAAALDLGAFAARHAGRRLVIGVDGLENVGDHQQRVRLLAALRGAAIVDMNVCVTSRLLEWKSARGSAGNIGGWAVVELGEWPEERIRDQVNASGRPRVGTDLVRLLRTPLLLDLFLRTFGRDAEVPAGLQTRHGLLQAYWDRRILLENDERSAERCETLLTIAAAEAAGTRAHSLIGDAPRDLTSEGLLSLSHGLRSFRHALLRDFAMMTWTQQGTASAAGVVERIETIQPSLVQFGALRAVLEAAAASESSVTSILPALQPPLLFSAASVFGEFEDLSRLTLTSIVDAVDADQRIGFLRALLAAIKLDKNIAWAAAFTLLPDDAVWAEDTGWLTTDVVLDVVDSLEAMSDELAASSSLGAELAARLRSWSLAPRLFGDPSGNRDFALGRLTKLVAKMDASPETVVWLTRIAGLGSWTRFWVLSELPELVQALVARGEIVDDDALRLIYRVSAGLRDDAGRLRDDGSLERDAIANFDRAGHSLIGQGKSVGLISSRPSAFVPVAIDLIAGHEADAADEREERLRDFMASLPADLSWCPELPEEVQAMEATARATAGDELPELDAGGGLIVNSPVDGYWELDSDHAQLLLHLRTLAETSLAEDFTFFDTFLWPGVQRSRSALARVCILDLLTRNEPCPRGVILDELLRDGRLYFLRCAQLYLQRGIQQRWMALSQNDRQVVCANVLNCGRGPAGNIYLPGPLVAAVPEGARPVELNVFLDLYRVTGLDLELKEAPLASVASCRPFPEADRGWAPIEGLSEAQQEPWRSLANWERGRIAQATRDEWAQLVVTIEALVNRCLVAPEALLTRSSLVERLREFAVLHARPRADERTARLSTDALRNLARWIIDTLPALSPDEVIASCEPLDGVIVGLPPRADLWMNLVDLADSVLWEPELRDDEELNGALFSAIDDVAKAPPDRLAFHILARVRGWFRANTKGKPVLWTLLSDRVRHGGALSRGLRYLGSFEQTEQEELLRKWLTMELSPAISSPRAFAREAGGHLGCAAMIRHQDTGEPIGSSDVLREFVAAPSSSGLLSDPSVHALFVGQSVFGAKEAVANGVVPLSRASEFAARMSACWQALLPSLDEGQRNDAPAFALWVFQDILGAKEATGSKLSLTPEERLAWWHALKPLAISIAGEGPSREVHALLSCLKTSPLLALVDVAEIVEVLVRMSLRTEKLTRQSMGPFWDYAISCASSVIEALAARTSDAALQDQLHKLVATWAAPPLVMDSAGAIAKRLRA